MGKAGFADTLACEPKGDRWRRCKALLWQRWPRRKRQRQAPHNTHIDGLAPVCLSSDGKVRASQAEVRAVEGHMANCGVFLMPQHLKVCKVKAHAPHPFKDVGFLAADCR